MKRVLLVSFLVLGAFSVTTQAAKVYTWTDAQGVTHYGEHPPKNVTARLVNARTGHSDPVPEGNSAATASSATPQSDTQPQRMIDPERCETAQKNLDALNTNARIKIKEADGSMRILSEQERQAKFDENQRAVEESCE